MKTWMRWGTCAVGVGLTLVPMTGRAQETGAPEAAPEVRRTVVQVQPLAILSNQVVVGVEHAVGSHVALAGEVGVTGSVLDTDYAVASNSMGNHLHSETWGVGVAPGVHFYFTGHAPEGFWVGPHVELSTQRQFSRNTFTYLSLGEPGDSQPVTFEGSARTVTYGGSVRLGYTAILSPGLTVQVGVGLAGQKSRTTAFTPKTTPEGTSVLGAAVGNRSWSVAPRMTLAVGWAL